MVGRDADHRALAAFELLVDLAVVAEPSPFRTLLLSRTVSVFNGGHASLVEMPPRQLGGGEGYPHSPPPDLRLVWDRYGRQHPIIRLLPQGQCPAALRLSDLVSRRELANMPIYQEFLRPYGSTFTLGLRLSPPEADLVVLAVSRPDRDFSDTDLCLADRLAPPLAHLFRASRSAGLTADLTRREGEVLALVAEGMTNGQIGRRMRISPATVRKHLQNASRKLGADNRAAAVATWLTGCGQALR